MHPGKFGSLIASAVAHGTGDLSASAKLLDILVGSVGLVRIEVAFFALCMVAGMVGKLDDSALHWCPGAALP